MEINHNQENTNEMNHQSSEESSIHHVEKDKSDVASEQENKRVTVESPAGPIRYAGFWMRFWAYLLDLIVVGSLVRLLVKPVFRILDISLTDFNMFAPISIASAVIFYLYFVLMTKYLQQTLGKMVFGIKVINLKKESLTWGTVLFREWIGRFISATIIIGYVIAAFLPKKQGLHDLFSDTIVIHVER
ncbi:RDD family protein [Bacillus xiapuensis]|uniref:RDD family protein n=1 Tax=Bacillus xiapuensis TaxID=2014075 RepID=A0ABU6NCT5_9BACI|nr:RDD family protein [Bacillus xiapuensis]